MHPNFSEAFQNARAKGFDLLESNRITAEQYAFMLAGFELAMLEQGGIP